MFGISEVIEHAYTIYHKDEVPEQIKLHALELISDCQQRRLDMATSGSIIEQGVAYVERMRSNLNHLVRAIPEDEVREMLHEEIIGNDDSSDERNDESSGFTGVDAVDNPNGIDDSSVAATPLEDQSDESLSLTDPNNSPPSYTTEDDNLEEDSGDTTGSTTNTVF
jgi:hypothetical protein